MKLTSILLTVAFLQVKADGLSQTVTFTGKDVPLEKVFTAIKQQTGHVFFYTVDIWENAKPVTLNVKNALVEDVLRLVLKNLPLDFIIENKTIIISKKKGSVNSATQANIYIDVRGRVVNEKGEPVAGVTVTIKGTKTITTTNSNGEFSLSSVDADAVLIFTHVSLETRELKVSGKTDLAISLKTKVSELGDVTVTLNTGYEKVPKERATGSFEFVNNEELNRKAGIDILSRIEGVATGVLFDKRSSNPNYVFTAVQNILIRGLNTMSEPIKAPLIVIDNFPYDGDINNINPNDVENITILKDAAAASIWGARAGNGVIVLTTKRGKFNQPFKISINSNFQLTQKPDLFTYPYMSSEDYIEVEKTLFSQGYFDAVINDPLHNTISPVVQILDQQRKGVLTSHEAEAKLSSLTLNDVRRDFSKYVYQNGINSQYALNLSGGTPLFQYYFSGGLDKVKTTLRGNEFQRVTFRSSNTLHPYKKLELKFGIAYATTKTQNNSLGDIGSFTYDDGGSPTRRLVPYSRFADDTGNFLATSKIYDQEYTDTAGGGRLLDWKFRPLQELNEADNTKNQQDFVFNAGANYQVISDVNFEINYQYQRTNNLLRNYYSDQTFYTRNLINLFTQINGNAISHAIPLGGILDQTHSNIVSQNGRAQVNIQKSIKNDHQISGLIGAEIREVKEFSNDDRAYGFKLNTYTSSLASYLVNYQLYGGRGSMQIPNINLYKSRTDHFVSIFANLAYTYKGRYTLSSSARRDASNLFGVDINDKWKPFWTIGGAWDIHKELFFNSNFFSRVRLRSTFGYQGNVNNSLSPYAIIGFLNPGTSLINETWATLNNPANKKLGWEKQGQLNIGIEFGILGNRISGSVDAYSKKASNLLWVLPLDLSTGLGSIKANSAVMVGKGIDIALNTINTKGTVQWNTEIGYSFIKNKVKDYDPELDKNLTAKSMVSNGSAIAGRRNKSPYAIISYSFGGLEPTTGDPLGYLGKTSSKDYIAISNQIFDTASLIYHGSAIPTSYGYLNNIVSYKAWILTININYRFGFYFRKNTVSYYRLINSGEQHPDFAKRWKSPGDESNTTVPSFIYPLGDGNRDEFYENSSANVYKGDNIRLQNIRLGYKFHRQTTKANKAIQFQVYANIENTGILWRANEEDLDPDYNRGNSYFPVPRLYTLGFQLEF